MYCGEVALERVRVGGRGRYCERAMEEPEASSSPRERSVVWLCLSQHVSSVQNSLQFVNLHAKSYHTRNTFRIRSYLLHIPPLCFSSRWLSYVILNILLRYDVNYFQPICDFTQMKLLLLPKAVPIQINHTLHTPTSSLPQTSRVH